MKKIFFLLVLLLQNFIKSKPNYPESTNSIYIFSDKNSEFHDPEYYHYLKNVFDQFHIKYKEIDTIDKTDDENLYILFNPIKQNDLPRFYIIYQTVELTREMLDERYYNKLANAIAIWDFEYDNILKYISSISHYYHFPKNYKYSDPVILPCFLPTEALLTYKEMLIQSNTQNSDTSSLKPIIFVHSILNNPKLIVEDGVAFGGTTPIFYKAANFSNAKLIGVDIQSRFSESYSNLKNSLFFCINDLDFVRYYQAFNVKDKIDTLFIDTSHEFEHTMQEIDMFIPLLNDNGVILFHDSNVTPFNNNSTWLRLNYTWGYSTPGGNSRGVTEAIKKYSSISFDEEKYYNSNFIKDNIHWKIIHYPFCNGLTILKKLN